MTNELPKIDFTTFLLSISSAAFMSMGFSPESPESFSAEHANLDLAAQNIDLLELIEEKTRGNRTPEEDRLMQTLLFEIRMKFLEVKKSLK